MNYPSGIHYVLAEFPIVKIWQSINPANATANTPSVNASLFAVQFVAQFLQQLVDGTSNLTVAAQESIADDVEQIRQLQLVAQVQDDNSHYNRWIRAGTAFFNFVPKLTTYTPNFVSRLINMVPKSFPNIGRGVIVAAHLGLFSALSMFSYLDWNLHRTTRSAARSSTPLIRLVYTTTRACILGRHCCYDHRGCDQPPQQRSEL